MKKTLIKKAVAVLITVCTVLCITLQSVASVNAADEGAYSISRDTAYAGETVEISLSLTDNPGIISLRFSVEYDESALELVSVKDTGLFAGYSQPSPNVSSPYILRWADALATENNNYEGEFAKLVFKVKDTASAGEYSISIHHIESRTWTGETVSFADAESTVLVYTAPIEPTVILGDFDGDGIVSIKDINVAKKILSGAVEPTDVQRKVGDMNGDGVLNSLDGNKLMKYVGGIM